MGGAVRSGSDRFGIFRGLCLLVYRQVQKRVGSVSEPARSMGGAELSIYLAMIDVQKKLKEIEAKVSVLWLANQMAHGEPE